MKLKTTGLLASSKAVLCCSSFALFSCVCSSMIYRVTLSKGWISKDTDCCCGDERQLFFLWCDCLLIGSSEGTARMTQHCVWRLMSLFLSSLTSPVSQSSSIFPRVTRRRKQIRACHRKWNQTRLPSVARKLRNRLPRSDQCPSRSVWHLLNITDLIFIVRSENISLQIGNGLYKNRGGNFMSGAPVTSCHEFMTEVLTIGPKPPLNF